MSSEKNRLPSWKEFQAERESFSWPEGRKVAVIANVAYEAWSDGKVPGIGPMGNPLPQGAKDTNARSWGNYAKFQGLDRVLRILDRTKVTGSVMVSGILAERLPDNVKAILEAGHEIIGHSWAQDVVPALLDPDADRDNVAKTTQAIEAATGVKPKGWASPRSTPSDTTLMSLIDNGYDFHSDAMDADRPYLSHFDNGSIVSIPFAMDINDLPHSMRWGRSPAQYVEMFDDFLARALKSDDGAIIIDVTVHPHCYGRPGTAWAYEEVLAKASARDDIWMPTRAQVVEHFHKTK